jgi:hypothetical protein
MPVLVLLVQSHVWTKPACCSQRLLQRSADNWLIRRLECNGIVHISRNGAAACILAGEVTRPNS